MTFKQGLHRDGRPSIRIKIDDERYIKISFYRLHTVDETTYMAHIVLKRKDHHSRLLGYAYQGGAQDNTFIVTRGLTTVTTVYPDDLPRAARKLYEPAVRSF